MDVLLFPPIIGVIGLIAAFIIYQIVKQYSPGEGAVAEISEAIHSGAMVFMSREYRILFPFAVIITVLLLVGFGSWHTPVAFAVGALCSGVAG